MGVPCNNCNGEMNYIFDGHTSNELGYTEDKKSYVCKKCGSKLSLSEVEFNYRRLFKLVNKLIER